MNIAERLREIRLNSGLTQSEFAEKVGTKQAYIQRYETGTKLPDTFLCSLIDTMGVDIEWLLTGKEKESHFLECGKNLSEEGMIPLISNVAAGESYAAEIPYEDRKMIPALPGIPLEDSYALEVQGDSMEPVISEGDILIVSEMKGTDNIFIGLDYVVVTESGPMVKTIYYERDEHGNSKMRLASYNRTHRDIIPHEVFRIFRILRHIKSYRVPEQFDKERRIQAAQLQDFGCFVSRRKG